MKTSGTYTDGMGFTEDEWERMWDSETATTAVSRTTDDDDEAWEADYEFALGKGMTEAEAVEYADSLS